MSNTLFEYLCAKFVKGANQSKRYVSRLSTSFLWTNIVCLSARKSAEKRGIGLQKTWLWAASLQLSLAHQIVSGAPGWSAVNSPLSGFDGGVRLSFTGLSGEPTVASANGRPRNLRATRGLLQRSAGAPDSVRCANQPRGATVGYAKFGRDRAPDRQQDLSGAPLDRRQELPSKIASNGS
jgi:hypothetical protein